MAQNKNKCYSIQVKYIWQYQIFYNWILQAGFFLKTCDFWR